MSNSQSLPEQEQTQPKADDIVAKKAKEIFDIVNSADDSMDDLEELNILAGQGVEYKIKKPGKPDLKFLVPVLNLYEYRKFLEFSTKAQRTGLEYKKKIEEAKTKEEKDILNSEAEIAAVDITLETISNVCNVPQETLGQYLRTENVLDIQALLAWGRLQGSDAFFKKKSLSRALLKEMRKSIITTLANNSLGLQAI